MGMDMDDIDLESFGTKEKKKKKRGEGLENLDDLKEAVPEVDEADKDVGDMDDLDDMESFGVKKKKKKKDLDELDIGEEEKENEEGDSADPWTGSDRDYVYDELLQRVFGIMRDKNPEMVAGEKKKFVMRPPQVVRVGSKKTAFANFTEIAKCCTGSPNICSHFCSLS